MDHLPVLEPVERIAGVVPRAGAHLDVPGRLVRSVRPPFSVCALDAWGLRSEGVGCDIKVSYYPPSDLLRGRADGGRAGLGQAGCDRICEASQPRLALPSETVRPASLVCLEHRCTGCSLRADLLWSGATISARFALSHLLHHPPRACCLLGKLVVLDSVCLTDSRWTKRQCGPFWRPFSGPHHVATLPDEVSPSVFRSSHGTRLAIWTNRRANNGSAMRAVTRSSAGSILISASQSA